MKEKLYTIPVNEAFDADSECPVCLMFKSLEDNAIDFTMSPSYMEDDIRIQTSLMGFCQKHLKQLYDVQNRLGLALILKSHMDELIKNVGKHTQPGIKIGMPSLFKKKGETSGSASYIEELEGKCFVCSKIEGTFERYIATVFHLYRTEEEFRRKFSASKGFCTSHYKTLYIAAEKYLSGEEQSSFIKELNRLYIENMKRVRDDLEWYINKFDYRYENEPWKNARDALIRSMLKTNSIVLDSRQR
ncbi:MAG: hypothetical protein GX757_05060 [Clostridiales bacterium]|nr:hypothetical protein [Clostridiales bacterium]